MSDIEVDFDRLHTQPEADYRSERTILLDIERKFDEVIDRLERIERKLEDVRWT